MHARARASRRRRHGRLFCGEHSGHRASAAADVAASSPHKPDEPLEDDAHGRSPDGARGLHGSRWRQAAAATATTTAAVPRESGEQPPGLPVPQDRASNRAHARVPCLLQSERMAADWEHVGGVGGAVGAREQFAVRAHRGRACSAVRDGAAAAAGGGLAPAHPGLVTVHGARVVDGRGGGPGHWRVQDDALSAEQPERRARGVPDPARDGVEHGAGAADPVVHLDVARLAAAQRRGGDRADKPLGLHPRGHARRAGLQGGGGHGPGPWLGGRRGPRAAAPPL
mmetsp:Transcript_25228/g.59836  ORF Transcript_25228/g.59836 Transcript_25228/m.59836 type:complete len:283 (+) Transcript_25228:867-1715(+)